MGGRGSEFKGKQSNVGKSQIKLSAKAAKKIERAAWGEDAISTVLNAVSDKLDGFDSYGDSFDVSYQGSRAQLVNEMAAVYRAAGVDVTVKSGEIIYSNGGTEVHVFVIKENDDDYTFTEKSKHYGIYVENWE